MEFIIRNPLASFRFKIKTEKHLDAGVNRNYYDDENSQVYGRIM